jgi:hypothetical protein
MTHENVLYLIIGALILFVAVLVYERYEARDVTSALQVSAGKADILIEMA